MPGQVRTGQERSGQVRTGQDRSGQVRTGWDWSGRTSQVGTGGETPFDSSEQDNVRTGQFPPQQQGINLKTIGILPLCN